MNAVELMASLIPPEAVRRLAALRVGRFESPGLLGTVAHERRVLDNDQAIARVIARWGDDLCGLLNALTRGELGALANALRVELPASRRSYELRAALWSAGARYERGDAEVTTIVQPKPVVLGGHLVVQAAPRGLFPSSEVYPRALPPPALPAPPVEEPDTVDDLLAAADAAIGVRLGPRGENKGAWGTRAQALLGVANTGDDEPDWRGDVEIKTVPIARDPSGLWRVVEDPAIAMVGEGVIAKLQRTLWLARAGVRDEHGRDEHGRDEHGRDEHGRDEHGRDEHGRDEHGRDEHVRDEHVGDDATIVSWYLLDWDPDIARMARRYLHDRPKGPAGTSARGRYLGKRFFADCGLLATLNGQLA